MPWLIALSDYSHTQNHAKAGDEVEIIQQQPPSFAWAFCKVNGGFDLDVLPPFSDPMPEGHVQPGFRGKILSIRPMGAGRDERGEERQLLGIVVG